MASKICPICEKDNELTNIPAFLESDFSKVCKACARKLWQKYDIEQGVGVTNKPRRLTKRQQEIARVAKELGAEVTAEDVRIIMMATNEVDNRRKRVLQKSAV